ncbi:hypothetical protein ACIQU4_27395 [Streptomyces sp. NPDC090741]|uniref:hypothetical protein n=1 Tax=Streptomyces sp. NPDC090741 TaxID=3365967 RepID=UPI00382E4B4E
MNHTAESTPRRTPEQVIAHQVKVIGTAVDHLDATDRTTLLGQLADTTIRDRFKADPEALAELLRTVTADSPAGLRYSSFAGATGLLRAAGKTPPQ